QGQDLRAVLHHQGAGQGHGPGPRDRVRHRAAGGRVHLGVLGARPWHELQDLSPAGGRDCGGGRGGDGRACAARDGDGAARRGRRRGPCGDQTGAGASGLHGGGGAGRRGGSTAGATASRSHSPAPDRRGDAAREWAGAGGAARAGPPRYASAVRLRVHGRFGGATRHSRVGDRVSAEAVFAGVAGAQGARRTGRTLGASLLLVELRLHVLDVAVRTNAVGDEPLEVSLDVALERLPFLVVVADTFAIGA